MNDAIQLIAGERSRQIHQEGWTYEHDDEYKKDELSRASAFYALPAWARGFSVIRGMWPWNWECFKPTSHDRIRELVKAGALICAEIDRLQRLQKQTKPNETKET